MARTRRAKNRNRETKDVQSNEQTKNGTMSSESQTDVDSTPRVKRKADGSSNERKAKRQRGAKGGEGGVPSEGTPRVKKRTGTPMKSGEGDLPTALEDSVEGPTVFHRSNKYVGAHCSVAGSLENAVLNAVEIGAKAFALYVRSHRTWNCKPLSEEVAQKFRTAMKEHGYPPHLVLPHGSYLLNCGSPNREGLEKSRQAIIDELKRCEMLGLSLYNFHPGSTCGEISVEECIDRIAETINLAHKETEYVTTVLENMSCQGNTIGGHFEELKAIIDKVEDKSRVGVCLDTCHAFAAGYDLSKEAGFNKMIEDFESIIGLKYLRALHLNDSKGKVGCHLDRHENIGKGHIGLDGFRRIMNDSRFNNIPLILETPPQLEDFDEINILYKLCKK